MTTDELAKALLEFPSGTPVLITENGKINNVPKPEMRLGTIFLQPELKKRTYL